MNNHTVIGVDLAKTVFQVAVQHGQKITSNKKLNRSKLVEFMTQQLPSVVVMEGRDVVVSPETDAEGWPVGREGGN